MKKHIPVLLKEVIHALNINNNGLYIDATFGYGGHSKNILKKIDFGKLFAFDCDLEAIEYGNINFKNDILNNKLKLFHNNFSNIRNIINKYNVIGKINGILFDLGVSSPQLNVPERGFSFMNQGPIDMRMNKKNLMTAFHVINNLNVHQLSYIFKNLGEERYAFKIAKSIKKEIKEQTLSNNTLYLANIIEQTIGRTEKKHPATRCFQALRMYVNNEINEINNALKDAFALLKPKGRLVVISFHSIEDRIVKNFMNSLINNIQDYSNPLWILDYINNHKFIPQAKWIEKKIKPGTKELINNIRSRSAILRVLEKH